MSKVKLSAQMIVFNGLSILPKGMLGACISNIYDICHEILIAEGAVRPAGGNPGNATWASKNGRSTDGTLEFLRSFPDPDKKIKIFIKENDFWDGKLEMCNACLSGMSGTHLYQVDNDEFLKPTDLAKIIWMLENHSDKTMVEFFADLFFGDYDHCCDYTQTKWANSIPWRRIFKFENGAKWISHAPPILSDGKGRPLNESKKIDNWTMLSLGIKLYHYAYVTRSQAEFKDRYYGKNFYVKMWDDFQKNKDIYIVQGDKSLPFVGTHPEVIEKIRKQ